MEVATEAKYRGKGMINKVEADRDDRRKKSGCSDDRSGKTEYELDDLVEGTEKELLLVSFGYKLFWIHWKKRLEKSIAIWKNSSLIMWWRMLLQAR